MATDNSTDMVVLLDAYLAAAMALVGLARTAANPDSFDQIVASVRRTYKIAGEIIRQLPDDAARGNLSSQHAKLAAMLEEVCGNSSDAGESVA